MTKKKVGRLTVPDGGYIHFGPGIYEFKDIEIIVGYGATVSGMKAKSVKLKPKERP